MTRGRHGVRPASIGAAIGAVLALAGLLAGALADPALGAKLVGGRRQAAIERAFSASRAHRHQLIVSVRASTVSPAWAVVESVRPQAVGRRSAGARNVSVQRTFFDLVHGAERHGTPPPATRADLTRNFQVAVIYTGSGHETINDAQSYRSACAGAGGFVDQETDTVAPMSWRVRYVVDLDDLAAAVSSAQGAIIEPTVSLDRGGSELSASERITRSSVDHGCNRRPTNYDCSVAFSLPGGPLDGILSLEPGGGLEIGVPIQASDRGQCDPDNFTLGPSLWDSGATTALVPQFGLVDGTLPANPYAPIRVAWPTSSEFAGDGFLAGPCQGIAAVCSDSMHWNGTVVLAPVSAG